MRLQKAVNRMIQELSQCILVEKGDAEAQEHASAYRWRKFILKWIWNIQPVRKHAQAALESSLRQLLGHLERH